MLSKAATPEASDGADTAEPYVCIQCHTKHENIFSIRIEHIDTLDATLHSRATARNLYLDDTRPRRFTRKWHGKRQRLHIKF
jgi:hypothetical protein